MNEKEENSKSFWKGLVAGLGAALLVSVLAFTSVKVYQTFCTIGNATKKETQQSVANSGTVEKLAVLEDTIQEYFWQDVTEETLEEGVYKGILEALDDPYSVYYTNEELLKLQQDTEGIYYGIGAYISQKTDMGYVQISKVIKNTPAEESGFLKDDYIYKVNGEDMLDQDSTYVVSKIKGEEGTKVVVTVIREGVDDPIDIEVERRKIETPTVEYEMLENDMAYIQIAEFDLVTASQFETAYQQAKQDGMKGLVLDLRGNPGGNLSTVCDIARMLLPKGLIVYTEDKYGERVEYTCDGSQQIEVPMTVLTDGYSASASEILAGAIKDYGIGTLVGTTTYGKGIVQKVINLSDGSAVKLTVSTYYTPKGNNIHKIGVIPDVEVEFDAEQYAAGVDNQLEKAKEVLAEKMGLTK